MSRSFSFFSSSPPMDRPLALRPSILWTLGIYAALTALWYVRPTPRPQVKYVAVPVRRTASSPETSAQGIGIAGGEKADDKAQEGHVRRGWWALFAGAVSQWSSHKDARLGAALAYYSIFSLGPLIVVVALRAWAEKLGLNDAAALLEETLEEEKKTDKALTQLAEAAVNDMAEAA